MSICANCGTENALDAKFCGECAAPLGVLSGAGEKRKIVTVLFCDLTGSTALGEALDPERLRVVLAGYFERMKAIVESHGGTVEKFIGDAVMAVFGVPVLHEDDALRACRAAVEMREVLPELGLLGRIGVMTGEVVTGTAERLATGDAVNVAARLEQAAAPGEVLVGQLTFELVGDSVEVEPVEPLALKGKAEPVPAYRLVGVREAPERQHEARLVGRERDLAILGSAWERVQAELRCELVTVVGDAGVGKSRLAAELIGSVDAIVARGRCLPYGEGITYWPVIEVLKQLDVVPADVAAATAIRSLLGEPGEATSADELAWAFRKTLEQAAAKRPLVVVFDDIHWAEETFLDLVEHVALLSSGAAILLVCIARPEFHERRPAWPVTLRLAPLADADVDELIPTDMPAALRARIVHAAGGNPLFVGEMLAMADEAGGGVVVPPTLQALLAARLDQLEPPERSVLERGAVEGEIFHRGAVQALAQDGTQVTPRLAALVRKELIRPDTPQFAGEDGFRFRHLLIRDAAYDALPKAVRAELHERFAAWLAEHGQLLVEFDEVIGYHLEQTCRYRSELGLPQDSETVAAARGHLGAAGRRATNRLDYVSAVKLLERAAELVAPGEVDIPVEINLVDALRWVGRGDDALRRAGGYADRAAQAGDRRGELCGKIQAGILRTFRDPEGATERLAALVEGAMPVFEDARDHLALYVAHCALGHVANMRGRMDALAEAYDRVAANARLAGLPYQLLGFRSLGRFSGTTSISEFVTWLDEQEPADTRSHWVRGRRAAALAMLGRFDEARALLAALRVELHDRGDTMTLAAIDGENSIEIELLDGDAPAAVEFGERGCRILEELGEQAALSTAAGRLSQAFYQAGRLEDAETWTRRAEELGASDDALTQMLWRQVRAKVLARRGEQSAANRLAREAVSVAESTENLNAQGDAYADLAEVLSLTGDSDEAAAALLEALGCYERKGNIVSAERVRAQLAQPDR